MSVDKPTDPGATTERGRRRSSTDSSTKRLSTMLGSKLKSGRVGNSAADGHGDPLSRSGTGEDTAGGPTPSSSLFSSSEGPLAGIEDAGNFTEDSDSEQ
jgi:hypothetical protein